MLVSGGGRDDLATGSLLFSFISQRALVSFTPPNSNILVRGRKAVGCRKSSFLVGASWFWRWVPAPLMVLSGGSAVHESFSLAAGILGNLFAFVLFVSPIPTFKRIVRHKSTEDFSGLPYIYALLNCLICMWYGLPFTSKGIILVATVNSVGALFQLVYVIIFIIHAEHKKKINMSGLLFGVFALFGLVVYVSLNYFVLQTRQMFVGYLSVASLISMFASPLFIINLVIRTRSVEFMPFYLSLSTFLMSISFFAYGMLKYDFFIYIPNGIGAILGAVQLILYAYYGKESRNVDRLPLLE